MRQLLGDLNIFCHSRPDRESRNIQYRCWIPAFAGMTALKPAIVPPPITDPLLLYRPEVHEICTVPGVSFYLTRNRRKRVKSVRINDKPLTTRWLRAAVLFDGHLTG